MAPSSLRRRLFGFMLLPAVAALSPLIVLPVVARTAGPGGWASAVAGETVGAFVSIAIGYGWATIGPALISIAGNDAERARIYRESLVVRLLIAAVALPVLSVACWFIASPGTEWLTVLMGIQGALIALSFTWYCAGVGDPRTIVLYDAVPRLLATGAAAVIIAFTGVVEIYPLAGIAVTLGGTGLFTARLLRRHRGPWPRRDAIPRLLRANLPVATNDAALSGYSSVPAPMVNLTAPPVSAAGFASAEKMLKLGQFLPTTLANAFQSWIGEAHGEHRSRRMVLALGAHAGFGLLGWAVLAALGPWVSLVLFGPEAAAPLDILVVMGLVFAFFSTRTAMTRLILLPAGEAHAVLRATLIATVIGTPLMIGLGIVIGPLGAALGYAFTEGAATVLLSRRCSRAIRALRQQAPHHPD